MTAMIRTCTMDWTLSADKSKLYFAYGSNMVVNQMAVRCRRHELVGIARLDGYRFVINRRGVATIVPAEGSAVHGVVWSLHRTDEERLDVYEGIPQGLYHKEKMQVILSDGDRAEVMVYIASDSVPGESRNAYLERIVKAAKRHGLPKEYINELEKWRGDGDHAGSFV